MMSTRHQCLPQQSLCVDPTSFLEFVVEEAGGRASAVRLLRETLALAEANDNEEANEETLDRADPDEVQPVEVVAVSADEEELEDAYEVVAEACRAQTKKRKDCNEHHMTAQEAQAQAVAAEGFELDEGEGVEDYCFCDTGRHLPTSSMPFEGVWLCCDVCDRWCHGECVGLNQQQADALDEWVCPPCTAKPIVQAALPRRKYGYMTAQEARAQAAFEGLELVKSLVKGTTGSGYKGVSYDPRQKVKAYTAYKPRQLIKSSQGRTTLGSFATADEAALARARFIAAHPQPQPVQPPQEYMTAQEARAQAAAEGLELVKGTTGSGYKNVSYDPRHMSKSYKAYKPRGQFKKSSGRSHRGQFKKSSWRSHLGWFATAEEAALTVARAIDGSY